MLWEVFLKLVPSHKNAYPHTHTDIYKHTNCIRTHSAVCEEEEEEEEEAEEEDEEVVVMCSLGLATTMWCSTGRWTTATWCTEGTDDVKHRHYLLRPSQRKLRPLLLDLDRKQEVTEGGGGGGRVEAPLWCFFVCFFKDLIGWLIVFFNFLKNFLVRRVLRVVTLCLQYLNAMPRTPNTHTHSVMSWQQSLIYLSNSSEKSVSINFWCHRDSEF